MSYKPFSPNYLLPGLRIPSFFHRRSHRTTASTPGLEHDREYEPQLPAAILSPCTSPIAVPDTTSPSTIARAHPDTLRCGTCAADLAFVSQIVSKGFTGRHGRAFLVSPSTRLSQPSSGPTALAAAQNQDLINIRIGRQENRSLVTGMHTVADISCAVCATKLGWKYIDAEELAQRYKVGKYILETERVVGYRGWEDVDIKVRAMDSGEIGETWSDDGGDEGRKFRWWQRQEKEQMKYIEATKNSKNDVDVDVDEIEFDSQDEDECEDLFAGTWDPIVVARRRSKRAEAKKK